MSYFERVIIHMNIGWGPPSYRNTPGPLGVVTTSHSFVPHWLGHIAVRKFLGIAKLMLQANSVCASIKSQYTNMLLLFPTLLLS